jgi:5-methylthioadenosine/S-adenosylhomocysteine deaminase
MHLAESREESEFVRFGRGPFADAHRARGIPVTAHGCSPVGWAERGGALALAPLLIHCVQTDDADVAAIAAAGASVAHCPHSNAELGHGRLDLARLRAAGVRVGLGTDSVASGAPLDLFREARLARDAAGLTPADALRLLTVGGAAALGVPGVGAIVPGAWADLAAVRVPGADPVDGVLAASPADVRQTWVAGRLVWDGGDWPGARADERRAGFARAGAAARAALS